MHNFTPFALTATLLLTFGLAASPSQAAYADQDQVEVNATDSADMIYIYAADRAELNGLVKKEVYYFGFQPKGKPYFDKVRHEWRQDGTYR